MPYTAKTGNERKGKTMEINIEKMELVHAIAMGRSFNVGCGYSHTQNLFKEVYVVPAGSGEEAQEIFGFLTNISNLEYVAGFWKGTTMYRVFAPKGQWARKPGFETKDSNECYYKQ